MTTLYVTPAQIGDPACRECGSSRSARVRHSLTGMDKKPFTIVCVNIEWCLRRRQK